MKTFFSKYIKKSVLGILMALPLGGVGGGLLTSCQDKDIDIAEMKVAAPDASQIQGQLNGYNYTLTWPQPASGLTTNLTVYRGGSMIQSATTLTGTSYTQEELETGDEYWFVFRNTDGTNQSTGTVVKYTRPGAAKVKNLTLSQVEKADGSNKLEVTWDAVADAQNYEFHAQSSSKTISETLSAGTTSYTIDPVSYGETWTVAVIATNSEGKALPQSASLLIGKTKYAFVSYYKTADELIANGDDDEVSAWLWFEKTQPSDKVKYIYFGDIKSTQDIDPYRMLFFIRDIETGNADDVWNMPQCALDAAPIIGEWVKQGGNMLLWSHAVPYIGNIGRIDLQTLKSVGNAIGCGPGGYNGDVWKMAASVNTGKFSKDYTTHAIYKGISPEYNDSGIALIACKGAGWTEDHNCCFYDIPTKLTGFENTSKECYDDLTTGYGIYPLGTWDSQASWVSQFNVWEATAGMKTDYKGTILCIGNGGLEFSMKNSDGTPDKSASPKNNSEQATVLKIAQNCIDSSGQS